MASSSSASARSLLSRQTPATVLPWAISCSAVLSLRMICSAVCLVRFMVESPAQCGRLKTLIHPGAVIRVQVTIAPAMRRQRLVAVGRMLDLLLHQASAD